MLIESYPSADTTYITLNGDIINTWRQGLASAIGSDMTTTALKEKLLGASPETLEDDKKRGELRMQHKQDYMSTYRKEYKAKHKRVNITLTNEEYERVGQASSESGQKVTSFVKSTLLKEVDKVYLLPEDEKVERLILQIRSIGNNINQLTRHIHRSGFISRDDINQLRVALKQVENRVEGEFAQPHDLLGLIEKELASNPNFSEQLSQLLAQNIGKNKSEEP